MDPKDLILDGNGVMSTCSKTGPEMGSDKDNSIKKILKLIIWKYISQHPIHSSSCLQLPVFCKLQSSKSFVLSIRCSSKNLPMNFAYLCWPIKQQKRKSGMRAGLRRTSTYSPSSSSDVPKIDVLVPVPVLVLAVLCRKILKK